MTIPSAEECNTWLAVGPASSFSNITTDTARPLAKYIPRSASDGIGCKVFAIQDEDGDTQVAVEMPLDVNDQIKSFKHKREQILVFQYNGKFHAMDNKCPHSSYPLSNATPFDVEDFGIVLSAGITCPKHGWSFDLFTGASDRGKYELKRWEVQLRPSAYKTSNQEELEVWVRRRRV